jgi:CheY-like chemotaxis protein
MIAELLRTRGHEVVTAFDAASAIHLAETVLPDVAILDIGLPVMDGYELAVEIRRGPAKDTRLIALTGYGQASDKARSQEAGFVAHLVKPVDFAKLEAALTD